MSKRIAVLHSQVPFIRGGAEIMVDNLTNELRKRGYQVEFVAIPFKSYPYNTLLDSYLLWRTLDLTESCGEKIDLVIATKVPSFMISHPNKVTWLMHQHREAYDLKDNPAMGGMNTQPGGPEMIRRLTAMDNLGISESRGIYSISRNVSQRLKKFNHIDSTPLYQPPALAGRYEMGDFGDYILSVGRLDRNKRTELLIRALPYCDSHIQLKIAGRGGEMDALKALAEKLGVADRVSLLGFVPDDDVIKLYAGALGVCYPPIDEDYGYVTLEAFLSGKPVLTCHDSGGVLEFVRNGENGYAVDFDAQQMGAAFDRLYRDKRLARDMGQAGYKLVKDISWDNVIQTLTKTLR